MGTGGDPRHKCWEGGSREISHEIMNIPEHLGRLQRCLGLFWKTVPAQLATLPPRNRRISEAHGLILRFLRHINQGPLNVAVVDFPPKEHVKVGEVEKGKFALLLKIGSFCCSHIRYFFITVLKFPESSRSTNFFHCAFRKTT